MTNAWRSWPRSFGKPPAACGQQADWAETYNRMYGKMRTVNKMLAWGRARVIENLWNAAPK